MKNKIFVDICIQYKGEFYKLFYDKDMQLNSNLKVNTKFLEFIDEYNHDDIEIYLNTEFLTAQNHPKAIKLIKLNGEDCSFNDFALTGFRQEVINILKTNINMDLSNCKLFVKSYESYSDGFSDKRVIINCLFDDNIVIGNNCNFDKKQQLINSEKSKIKDYYSKIESKNENFLVSVPPSTGSGKTYSIKKMVDDIEFRKFKKTHVHFSAPMKSHLEDFSDINERIHFNKKRILFTRVFARDDYYSLDTWLILSEKHNFVNNAYDGFFKKHLKGSNFKNPLVNDFLKTNGYIDKIINNIKTIEELKKINKEERDFKEIKNIEELRDFNINNLKKLLNRIIHDIKYKNKNSKDYILFKKLYDDNKTMYFQLLELIGEISGCVHDMLHFPNIDKLVSFSTFHKAITKFLFVRKKEKESTVNPSIDIRSLFATTMDIWECEKKDLNDFDLKEDKLLIKKKDYDNRDFILFIDESTVNGEVFNKSTIKELKLNFSIPNFLTSVSTHLYGNLSKYDFWYEFDRVLNSKKQIYIDMYSKISSFDESSNPYKDELLIQDVLDDENLSDYSTFFENFIKISKMKRLDDLKIINNWNNTLFQKLDENTDLFNYFGISEKTFFDILYSHIYNVDSLIINNKLLKEKFSCLESIFFEIDYSLLLPNREALKNMYVKKLSDNYEIVSEKSKDNLCNLYEYLMTSLILLFSLKGSVAKYISNMDDTQDRFAQTFMSISETINNTNSNYKEYLDFEIIKEAFESEKITLPTEDFVFRHNKMILSLGRVGVESNKGGNTSLNFKLSIKENSPEHIVSSLIENCPSDNIKIFKVSATDGIFDNVVDWDDRYLKARLNNNYLISSDEIDGLVLNDTIESINSVREKETNIIPLLENINVECDLADKIKSLEQKSISIYQREKRSSYWKIEEIKRFYLFLQYVLNKDNNINASLVVTQSTINFIKIVKNNCSLNTGLYFEIIYDESGKGVFALLKNGNMKRPLLKIIFYKSKTEENLKLFFNKESNRIKGEIESWNDVLNTTDIPLMIVGDYKNVSTGLNFTQSHKINGVTKSMDFDAISIIMDKHFLKMKSLLSQPMLRFDLLTRSLIMDKAKGNNLDYYDLTNIEEYAESNEFNTFIDIQNYLDYFAEINQLIGRGNRKDSNENLKILVNIETIKRMQEFKIKLEYLLKDSYDSLYRVFGKSTSFSYRELVKFTDSFDRYVLPNTEFNVFIEHQLQCNKIFNRYREKLLKGISVINNKKSSEINNDDALIIKQWEALRNIDMFFNFKKYIQNLKNVGFNEEFINSIILSNSSNNELNNMMLSYQNSKDIYIDSSNINKQYYTDFNHYKKKTQSINMYDFTNRLRANFFRYMFNNNSQINYQYESEKQVLEILDIMDKGTFMDGNLINFNFLNDFSAPFILEYILKDKLEFSIKRNKNKFRIIEVDEIINKYPYLYEDFDIYVENTENNELLCFDAKNFGRLSSIGLKGETFSKVSEKIKNFRKKRHWKSFKPILVNLISDKDKSFEHEDVVDIEIFSLYNYYFENEYDKYKKEYKQSGKTKYHQNSINLKEF